MSNKKYSKEFKLRLLKEHEENGVSFYQLEKDNEISFGTVRLWLAAYKRYGEDGLVRTNSMLCKFSAGFKQQVVQEYLAGGISTLELAHKHGIRAESTVSKWIKQYNSHEELTDSRPEGGEYLMTKGNKSRKTTRDERIKIVEYCIANANNYGLAAKEFNCSYGQVYSWVKKYEAQGIEGLYDRRGRNKPEDELTELEKLQAENRLLRAQAKQQQMEIDFLKKLDAVERR
ncbi:MAG: helix-turn-helix domain-containing protein [Lachnospiraceae bacterium]|nr:helix-turn-helix domain-containing protein [Lachnospiraceae bacterium]